MAKLIVLGALFLALMAFNEASTITTTTIEDDETTGKSQQCQKQVRGRQFHYCQKLMMQKNEIFFLNMVTRSNAEEERQQDMQQCCQQLQSVNSKCVCDAVREMMMKMPQMQPGGGQQGEQMEMMMKAANLPVMCGIRQQPCPMF